MKKKSKKIDFSDVPELTDAKLKSMRRVGRPTIGEAARQLIAIRIDPQVLVALQDEAKKEKKGYQTLINDILAEYIKKAGCVETGIIDLGSNKKHLKGLGK